MISPNGKILNQVAINCTNCVDKFGHTVPTSPHMLGLRFNPVTHALWVLDFGAGFVLNVDPTTGSASALAPQFPGSALNALTFDKYGNGYVSDSFAGTIWQINLPPLPSPLPWISDPLTLGNGTPFVPFGTLTPPFGANGVEFSNDGNTLFVANTAFHQIVQIPVNYPASVRTTTANGPSTIFITGINAPDGIAFDSNNNMWICANQEDEIVVINNTGKVIAKLGDFGGIDPKGIVSGLLFPASLAFSPDGQWLCVTNLTLNLPFAGANPAIDSAWTLQVNGYTVSRLPAKIPPISGN